MKHFAVYGWSKSIEHWVRLTEPITKKDAKIIQDQFEKTKSKKKPMWSKFKTDLYGELKP